MTKARDIASAIPAPSTVSSAELGYLDGVTSAIQTQVDAKTAKSTLTTTGDIYYASAANTPARLAIGSTSNVLTVAGGIPSWAAPAGAGFVGCRLYKSAGQNMANDTFVVINWDAESFDTDTFHDNSTNNSRITIPSGKAGKYLFTCILGLQSNTAGSRLINLRKNGATIANFQVRANNASGYPTNYIQITSLENAAVADYYEIRAWQDSTEIQGIESGEAQSIFSAIYLGA